MNEIRTLRADEIEARIATVTAKGCSLLLYKDARCDQRMLDEVFGMMNWQRNHVVIDGNLYCNVSVWDKEKCQWVTKQDVGTESYTEKEKGQASDSFKRACFNFGIGRELYSAPFVWVSLTQADLGSNGKPKTKFKVKEIGYSDKREIESLVIVDEKGAVRYRLDKGKSCRIEAPQQPVQQPQPTDDGLDLALQEIREAKTITELTAIFNNWNGMQADKRFMAALTDKKNTLKKNAA